MFDEVKGVPGSSVVSAENPIVPFGPTMDGWKPIGDAILSLSILQPLSEALPTVLQVDIPTYATGEVGFLNEGWWGIDVRPQTYNASFYMLANAPRDNGTLSGINVSLRSNLTDDVWSTATIPIEKGSYSSFEYTQFHAQIENDVKAPNSNNTFAVTFNATEVAGSTFYFNLISLFPETYKDRPNGLRKDLAQGIADLNPTFLRFPGGNNLEGYSISQRWKWNETIGPLKDRKGRVGDWNYYNTNGLGLLEFLEWTEDMGIEPFLGVYAGFSLDLFGQEGTSYPEDRMDEVLEEVLGELEYCMGDETTHYGKLRAEHGHPEPFNIKYIEIGNEDWFSTTYPYRFPYLYEGIKKAYPDVVIVSSAYNEHEDYTMDLPPGTIWDDHHYEEPSFYLNQFNVFDNWQSETNNSDVNILVGEYSVFQIDTESGEVDFTGPPDIHVAYPRLLSAIAEGVYLLGAERNPNVVTLSCYAPSFQNFNWYNWTPNLVGFTANYDETVFSVSYYLQQLFATHRGSQTLPVKASKGHLNPLWWVATIDETDDFSTAYVKVCPLNLWVKRTSRLTQSYKQIINSGNTSVPLTIELDEEYNSVNGTILVSPSYGLSCPIISSQSANSNFKLTDR